MVRRPSPAPPPVPLDAADPIALAAVPTERLEAHICELAAHVDAAQCRLLLLIAEFDRREAWVGWECRSAAQWLSWKCGISLHTAREHVRIGRALEELPRGDARRRRAAATVRRLGCADCTVIPHLMADGSPLDVGRAQRLLNRAQRRAVQRRDKGCRWPGCTRGGFLEMHHLIHWIDGGPTNLDNVANRQYDPFGRVEVLVARHAPSSYPLHPCKK